MGIGRRDFLAAFGAVLTALSTNSAPAAAVENDLYINRKLGIALRKPDGWTFNNVLEMGKVAKGHLLELDDFEIDALWDKATDQLPILSLSRDLLSVDGVQTDITLGVNIFLDAVEEDVEPELQACCDAELEVLEDLLPGWKLVSGPNLVAISDCPAMEYLATFDFVHEQLPEPEPMRLRALLIDHGQWRYSVRMYDAPERGTSFTFDYDGFVGSLRLI